MRRVFSSVPIVGVVLASVVIASDTGRASADPTPPGAAACTALAAATFTAGATLITTYDAGSAAQPAHCVVRGSAAPRTGVDGKAYETRFELRLPTDWSGRFLYQGGGGNDGIVAPAVGRNTGSFPDTGLQRGFAVVTTDAGHQGGTPEFGLDPSRASIMPTPRTNERRSSPLRSSRAITVALPIGSSFVGCSGGGRQGMMFAQRYPAYFDGIAICAPAMSVSSGATIAAAWDTQTYLSMRPDDEQGQPVLSRAFSDADLALVARGVTTACDAADGAVDGMVLRPEACRFDPKRLQCAGAKEATCLTSEQVAALERTFRGPQIQRDVRCTPDSLGSRNCHTRMAAVEAGHVADEYAERDQRDADGRCTGLRVRDAASALVRDDAIRLRSRSGSDGRVLRGLRHLPRCDARRVPQTRRQAVDLPRNSRSDLLSARVDRLLPASHPQQRRA